MKTNYHVLSVSTNTNSFGLRGVILQGVQGDAWEVGVNMLNQRQRGDVVSVKLSPDGCPMWHTLGYEIPRRLNND